VAAAGRERLAELWRIGWLGARNAWRALLAEDLRLRALALTTITLVALVPALVVAFSFLSAFGGTEALWRRAQDLIIDNLAVGARASIEPYLERFVRNAHATGAGLVGGAILAASAVGLFRYVEKAINELWGVRRKRTLVQKALIYWAGLTLGPILLSASLAVGHRVQDLVGSSWSGILGRAAAWALTCSFFAVLYAIVPFTKVRLGAAAAGGIVAGIAWELAKGLYTFAVARFFRVNAIYGSLAAIPIFIFWLDISWTLLLLGARVSFVVQHSRQLLRAHEPERTPLGRELLAARALLEVARDFRRGAPPPDAGEVAGRLEVVVEEVREVVAQLRSAELLLEVASGGLVPARPLDRLTLADVRRPLAGPPPRVGSAAGEALLASALVGAEGAADKALGQVSFEELCRRLDGSSPEGTTLA